MTVREAAAAVLLLAAALLVLLAVLEVLAAGFRRMWADRREVEVFRFEVGVAARGDITSVRRRVWPGGRRDVVVTTAAGVSVVLLGEERDRFLAWWTSPPTAG